MKKLISVILAFTFTFTACSSSSLTNVLDAAVIASTAAIVACPAFSGDTQACLVYAKLVNQDAEASIPIASNTTLTAAQVATQLIPIWSNVATTSFPNAGPEATALEAAVAAVVQIIELYKSKVGTAQGNQHLALKASDLAKVSAHIAANKAKIAATGR